MFSGAPDGQRRHDFRSSAEAPRCSPAMYDAAEPSVRSPERGGHGFPIIRAKAPFGTRPGVPRRSDTPRDGHRRVTSRLLARAERVAWAVLREVGSFFHGGAASEIERKKKPNTPEKRKAERAPHPTPPYPLRV